ncbi:transposase [bacterium]|nr:transposase [bacterium]
MTYAEEYYHVINRGNEKQPIYYNKDNYRFFLNRLRKYSSKGKQLVIAYCLMPNHFHLLMKETIDNHLKKTMLSLQTSYAKAINKRFQRNGHLFQDTYKKIRIENNNQLLRLSRYIHLNPVKAGLVNVPEEWPYSSYHEYAGLRHGSLPATEIIISQFPDKQAYKEFVMDHLDEDDKELDKVKLE